VGPDCQRVSADAWIPLALRGGALLSLERKIGRRRRPCPKRFVPHCRARSSKSPARLSRRSPVAGVLAPRRCFNAASPARGPASPCASTPPRAAARCDVPRPTSASSAAPTRGACRAPQSSGRRSPSSARRRPRSAAAAFRRRSTGRHVKSPHPAALAVYLRRLPSPVRPPGRGPCAARSRAAVPQFPPPERR
jgi:hypothetical protein